jgi:hypothetical protein
MKQCKTCQKTLEDTCFRQRTKMAAGAERVYLESHCRQCEVDIHKEYKKNLKETDPIRCRHAYLNYDKNKRACETRVTLQHLRDVWTGKCAINGSEIHFNLEGKHPQSAEVDKIIPSEGYVDGNVQWVSCRMNVLKGDGALEDFEQIISYLTKHKK